MPVLLDSIQRASLPMHPADVLIAEQFKRRREKERTLLVAAISGWALAIWLLFIFVAVPLVERWLG